MDLNLNIDSETIKGFGDEWSRFTQEALSPSAREKIFQDYFRIFPWQILPANPVGADIGCGSGRWAQVVAPRVGFLHLADASKKALAVSRRNLISKANVGYHHASVGALPFSESSLDFAYSLGVLHHVPDTRVAIKDIASKLKVGAPLLIYLYYSFDNRTIAYRCLWKASDWVRGIVCRLPFAPRYVASQLLAFAVYWPLARVGHLLETVKMLPSGWPLAYYRDKPFYVMRTDALDRFGTKLEHRFSRSEIANMMLGAGLTDLQFSELPPFWCAVGIKGR